MTECSYGGKSVSDEQDGSVTVNLGANPADVRKVKKDIEKISKCSQSVNVLSDEFVSLLTKSQMTDLRAAFALWMTIISDPDIGDPIKNKMYDYQYKNGTVTSSFTVPIELKKYGLRHFRFDLTSTNYDPNMKNFDFNIGSLGTIQSINWFITDWQKPSVVPSSDKSGLLVVNVQANIKELTSAVKQCAQHAQQECASLGVDDARDVIDEAVAAFGGSAFTPFITVIAGKAVKVIACDDKVTPGDIPVIELSLTDSLKVVKAKCPVDVYVYYKGNLCGKVVNNTVDESLAKSTFGSAVSVDGDQKTVYVPNDGVSIKLVGNGTGTMDYEIDEYSNITTDAPTRTVQFHNLPLTKGKTYTGTVSDKLQEPKSTYDLTTGGETVQADYDSSSASQNTGGSSHGSGGNSGRHGSSSSNVSGISNGSETSTSPVTAKVTLNDGIVRTVTNDSVIEIPISGMLQVGLTSGQVLNPFSFTAGNGSVIQTGTVGRWNGTGGVYSIYAPGSIGEITGIYANGILLFQAKIVDRPFKSDTTADIKISVNKDYTFCIKPEKAPSNFTFFTASGSSLQTSVVKDRYPAKDRRYFCRVKPVRKYNGLIGVYCRIDGMIYEVFSVGCK